MSSRNGGSASYEFSVPGIVEAHFQPDSPLLLRRMLLEIKVLGLRYLCPVIVSCVRDEADTYGFRYDTLDGHIERGAEWFLLTRNPHGVITFRIEARWQSGQFPNWWSRVGFLVVSGYYQRRWHRQAHGQLSLLAHDGLLPGRPIDAASRPRPGGTVEFTYHPRGPRH
jgi:hypothetical protein